jgi:hypothetical protein
MEDAESVLRYCGGFEIFIFRQERSDPVFSHGLDASPLSRVAETPEDEAVGAESRTANPEA